jgi:NADPH2:quinone reductase
MKAITFEKFGLAQDVLNASEEPKPEPGDGEVLVKVAASGVNPSDVKKRAGSASRLLSDGFVIPHSDGSGVIEAVGNGVSETRIGERVWLYQAQYERRFGTAAEYVAVSSDRAPRLPDAASFEIGACLGIPAMTSHRCILADGDVAGKVILVTGGAGRVGHYAIQWGNLGGAKVIASASNDADKAACLEAGAAAVVNHRDADFAAQILAANSGKKVDRIVDVEFGQNLSAVLEVAKIGATIATYSSMRKPEPTIPFYKMMFADITVRFVIVYAMPESAKDDAVRDINAALDAGKLQHRVTHVVPFDECARAHEIIEAGSVRGCVVLSVGQDSN